MYLRIHRSGHLLAVLFIFPFLTHLHTLKVMKSIKYEHKMYTGSAGRAR